MSRTQKLEETLKLANEGIELGELIEKLHRNPTFKKVILQSYYEEEAVRLVGLLSDANMQQAEQQQLIQNAMRGIGELKSWFNGMCQRATQLTKLKHDTEQELHYISTNPVEIENELNDQE